MNSEHEKWSCSQLHEQLAAETGTGNIVTLRAPCYSATRRLLAVKEPIYYASDTAKQR